MTSLMGSGRIVGDDLTEALYEAGVRIAFGLDDPRGYWVGLRRSKIRPVVVHDERSGGFMAEAFTRAGGGLATCSGISGPGAANLVPGLLEAYLSSVPVLAVLGEKRPAPFGGREFQGVDHRTLLAGVVKATVEVHSPDDIRSGATQAVRLATSGRPRPVLLLTRDLMQQQPVQGPTPAHVPDPRSAGDYVVAARPGGAHDEDITRAVDTLLAAREPVIVLGGGAAISGAGAVAAELAERIGAPIIATPMGKGVVAEDHPLACGIITAYSCGIDGFGVTALEILKRTDCVLIVGSDLDNLARVDGEWPTAASTVIRIDVDPDELRAFADIPLCGDAASTLRQLRDALPAEVPGAEGRRTQAAAEAARVQQRRRDVLAKDLAFEPDGTVWPARIIREIATSLGPSDVLTTDASFSSAWSVDRLVAVDGAPTLLTPRAAGTLGWGLPAALGAKLARPESRVIGLIGDGALFFSIGDMETAVREQIPVTIVVLDNASYGSQRHSNVLAQGRDYGDLHFNERTDLVGLAASFGWAAQRVSSGEALAAALAQPEDRPQMLVVPVDREHRPPIFKFAASGQSRTRE